jgi:hypothetical protein
MKTVANVVSAKSKSATVSKASMDVEEIETEKERHGT